VLGSLISKVYLNVLAFSVLLFSNYTGNIVDFSSLLTKTVGDNLVCSTYLTNAFENDFDEIFKSGKEIRVWFEFRALKDNKVIHYEKFYHQVKWNAGKQEYQLNLQEQNYKTNTKSVKELKYLLSVVEYPFYKANHNGNVVIEVNAYLPKIYLETISKEVDLMLLWKMKKPSIRKEVRL